MNTTELIQLIEPNEISALLAEMYGHGLTLYRWRLSPTGKEKLGRPFILRAKGYRTKEVIIGDFPTIPFLLDCGWLCSHVLIHEVMRKVKEFRE